MSNLSILKSVYYNRWNFKVMCWKFECRYDIHYKTQTGTSCEKCNSKAFRLGIEPATSGLLDQCSTTELQKPLPTTWARVQYIYINEMVMPVKNKGILIIIFGIYTTYVIKRCLTYTYVIKRYMYSKEILLFKDNLWPFFLLVLRERCRCLLLQEYI